MATEILEELWCKLEERFIGVIILYMYCVIITDREFVTIQKIKKKIETLNSP